MKKGIFLDMEVVYFNVIDNYFKRELYEVYDLESDIVRFINGRPKLLKEKDVVKEILMKGEGVVYNNKVIFLCDCKNKEPYCNFLKKYKKKNEDYKAYNKTLYSNCKNVYHFPIVKAIISLYKNGTIDKQECLERLKNYIDVNNDVIKELEAI